MHISPSPSSSSAGGNWSRKKTLLGGISSHSFRNMLSRGSQSNNTKNNNENTNPNLTNPPPSNPITTNSKHDEDPSVKVVVRIRPGSDRVVRKISPNSLSVDGDRRHFTFHSVLDSTSTQEQVFDLVGIPLVKNSLAGYNTSLLSCGQTGSGKTYTMWGPPSAMVQGHSPTSNQGIVPRIFQLLFSEIQEQENTEDKHISYQCRCSFLEIYNEQIGDLLDPTQRNLQIRDDVKNGFYVENLTEEYVTNYDDVTQILIKGLSNRKVGSTTINSKSSRSHIVFTCVIESWCKGISSKCFRSSKTSRISLVDVAGSERNKLDDDAGRLCIQEGRNVKKSLSQLGHLVHILAEGAQSDKSENIPYRSSCLTHLLKESLGGNAKLTVICAISPDERFKGETLSTLRFGLKVKSIQNKPVENEITEDGVNDLGDRIRQLKEELIKEKSSGYNSVNSRNNKSFGGRNARESLNQLRVSLNRSMILPRLDNDSEEVNVDDKDVRELCGQLDNLRSSGEENFEDACEETECFQEESLSEENCESNIINKQDLVEDEQESNYLSNNPRKDLRCIDNDRPATSYKSSAIPDSGSITIMPCQQSLFPQDPTPSESPKFEDIQKRSVLSSSNLSASQSTVLGNSIFNTEVQMQSMKRSDHIRASLRSSKMFLNPTESLAASLHRGLQIIDHHQRASASSKSSVALSFEHLALKPSQAINQSCASISTLTEGREHFDGPALSYSCPTCKRFTNRRISQFNEINESLNICTLPSDGPRNSEGLNDKLQKNGEAFKTDGLEKVCAEQAAKIKQLNLLVEQYQHEKEQSSTVEKSKNPSNHSNEDIRPMQDLEKEKHVLLEGEGENKVLEHVSDSADEFASGKVERRDLHEEREALLREIEILKNKLQCYVDVSWIESQSSQLRKSCNIISQPSDKKSEELQEERQGWIEKESEWICLTDELRVELDSMRRHAENVEMELRLEKKVTEELDDALSRSVLGHARIVEHYADLQDKYNELLERHHKIMEGVADIKRAAAKASAKGHGSRFVKSLAGELSALRVQREREREQLKKENKSLRIQLKDTAEAVHAAGELLVRLREAEETASIAEENYAIAQKETEKVKKQLEKQKRKHAMEMVTMKQYLAESRLPESALRPLHWQEEDKQDNPTVCSVTADDQAWRAEFGPTYQDRY